MSQATQWTTTYSSVFRDRRRYEAPNAAPSDPSWNVRTQGYYGRRADLSEHAARTAEVEARTQYGTQPANETATGGRTFPPVSTQGLGAAGLDLSGSNGSSSARLGSGELAGTSFGSVHYTHQHKDLWNHPILPHTGVVQDVPIGYGLSTSGRRPQFTNGYNNGYAQEAQFQEQFTQQNQYPQQQQQPSRPEQYIPGTSVFVRGSQFVHGNTFGRMTRDALSVPSDVPLEP